MQVTLVNLPKGTGYWRLTQYPYGGDFRRLTEQKAAFLIPGTVKTATQIRFKLEDGTIGITEWHFTGMDIKHMPNIFEVV